MVYENCEQCQGVTRFISRREEMPQQPMLYCEIFDILGFILWVLFLLFHGLLIFYIL